jgi:hypothetical protein
MNLLAARDKNIPRYIAILFFINYNLDYQYFALRERLNFLPSWL